MCLACKTSGVCYITSHQLYWYTAVTCMCNIIYYYNIQMSVCLSVCLSVSVSVSVSLYILIHHTHTHHIHMRVRMHALRAWMCIRW